MPSSCLTPGSRSHGLAGLEDLAGSPKSLQRSSKDRVSKCTQFSSQEHLLVCLFLVSVVFFAHHQDWTVGVPYHRVRDAAHQSTLNSPEASASQHYQACTDILPYSEDPPVWSGHPEVGSRNGSPDLLNSPYLLVEQPLAHLLDLLPVGLLDVEAHSVVVGGILRRQDESHVQLGAGFIDKVHCSAGSQRCLFRAVCGQEDLRGEYAHLVSLDYDPLLGAIGVSTRSRL